MSNNIANYQNAQNNLKTATKSGDNSTIDKAGKQLRKAFLALSPTERKELGISEQAQAKGGLGKTPDLLQTPKSIIDSFPR